MHIISRLHSNRMQYMYCSAGLLPMTYPIYRFAVLTTEYRNRTSLVTSCILQVHQYRATRSSPRVLLSHPAGLAAPSWERHRGVATVAMTVADEATSLQGRQDLSATQPAKILYLVRHAQSEQNVATERLRNGDAAALMTIASNFASVGYDAPVSEAGKQQLEAARKDLDGLVEQKNIALVVHSPLQRARDTALAIFEGRGAPLIELPQMHERTVSEYVVPSLIDQRIEDVVGWLASREERVIALVGHGQFFKRCLGSRRVQQNVEVIESGFNVATGFGAFQTVFDGYPDPGM